jgi:hypothetical protein
MYNTNQFISNSLNQVKQAVGNNFNQVQQFFRNMVRKFGSDNETLTVK